MTLSLKERLAIHEGKRLANNLNLQLLDDTVHCNKMSIVRTLSNWPSIKRVYYFNLSSTTNDRLNCRLTLVGNRLIHWYVPPYPSNLIMYVGRFAPTPSGDLHFGSIVTAIASYLDAKKVKGHWLLKIDDIDKQRVRNNSVLSILRTLESLNLFWDSTESYQSNRLDEYRFYFEKLSATHQTYNCSCSRKYLSAHAKLGDDGYIYPGFCRHKELENKDSYATRMEVSSNPIVIKDQIQGQLSQNLSRKIGDFVIKRNDGQFSYQFSVCVDNKLDKITNIVRGADLFSSTPRQVYLHNLLDFDIPKFSHIPIATLGKKKISKSDDCKIIIKNNQKDIWIKVLNFLKQPIAQDVSEMSLDELISHAIKNWTIEKISPLRSIDIS